MTTRTRHLKVRLKAPKPEALVPCFRFESMEFIYRLPESERKRLSVPKDNPGVVVVIA